MILKWSGTIVLALFGLVVLTRAGEWPQFRGPGSSGLSDESKLPDEWGSDKNISWKVKVPGVAWSSPVVWGDKIILTTAVTEKQTKPKPGMGGMGGGKFKGKGKGKGGPGGFGKERKPPDVMYRWEIHCLDRATGKPLWTKTAIERKPTIPIHATNSYASETPIVDGERIYAYFGMTGVFCYDLTGKFLWKKDLGAYKMMFGFGAGSSPTLADGRLFIQCDNEEKSFLVALDAKTGKELWRTPRAAKTSWSTPIVWRTKNRTELVASGGGKVCSYDPENGKLLWELKNMEGQASSSPVASEELLYVGCGGPFGSKPLVAVRAGAMGDITLKEDETSNKGVAWSLTGAGPGISSPLLYKGHLYLLDQRNGTLRCHDAKTGKSAYQKRLPQARGFTSSPWTYDDKVFCLDEDGKTFVIQAGSTYKLLGTNKLGEMFWSSPAIAGGSLYLRGVDNLYCIKR